jgi:hypothetical protein
MNYGMPKISRQAILQPIREWMIRAMSGTEFPSLFFSLMFLNPYATSLVGSVIPFGIGELIALLIIMRRAIWFIGNHGQKFWINSIFWNRFGFKFWQYMKRHESQVLHLSVMGEIFIGFWFIVLLFTPARQMLNIFVYWNFLRMRFMAPRSSPGHTAVWSQLAEATKSVRRSIPVLNKPIQMAVDWFNPAR